MEGSADEKEPNFQFYRTFARAYPGADGITDGAGGWRRSRFGDAPGFRGGGESVSLERDHGYIPAGRGADGESRAGRGSGAHGDGH